MPRPFRGAEPLERDLRRALRGDVRFDAGSRALYATDASNYRQVPIGVVYPRDADDVIAAVGVCRRHGAPILARGGGTSLAGQCCNVAVVLDFSRHMHRIVELDPGRRLARVEPGVVLDVLRDAAERHHLTFGPDPATHNRCTLGGMIGNDSCGVHSIMSGKTTDNVETLDVLTYDGLRCTVGKTPDDELARIASSGGRRGEIYTGLRALRDRCAPLVRERYPDIPRRVSGYNLDELLPERGFQVARALVGSEGTCVTVLEATLRLVESPPHRVLAVLGFSDVYVAADDVPHVLESGPIGLEGIDDRLIDDMRRKGLHPSKIRMLPDGRGWLLAEFGGSTAAEARRNAERLLHRFEGRPGAPSAKLFLDPAEQHLIWRLRESALGATAFVPGKPLTWEGWEDAAVHPDRLGGYLREFRRLLTDFGYTCSLYGHFGHGCVHTRIEFDLVTAAGIAKFRSFVEQAADLTLRYGGSLSGEHGDGQSRAELLPRMFGPELVGAFREFKTLWDPSGKMNPGKVVNPYRLDENLRLGTAYRPPVVRTHFAYAEDRGSFAEATLRCVGVGECRRERGGTMCPSYMVTREEKHSTRGRARLLFEMLQGDVVAGAWRDEHVKEALDLCLSCKGCKGECPVNVDMATYKAEFLAHYYQGRLRPMHAYAFGRIHRWARIAAIAPGLVNAIASAPVLESIVKRLAGIAPDRRLPRFAEESFQHWFRRREKVPGTFSALGAREKVPGTFSRVLLWPDTFNNFFHPETARAAVGVLEAAGFEVEVPSGSVCCGRPLYDYGMLDAAKRLLRQTLDTLGDELRTGTPIVVLEPSCAAVFRDELRALLPNNRDAVRLASQVQLLGEFLERHAPGWTPAPLGRRAILHGHCHQKALMGMEADERVLARLGLEVQTLDSGCCGMAGAFGFERDHYAVSLAVGERVLLPAVRAAAEETLILADGFSCRQQIAQTTSRHALHLAEVLALAVSGRRA